MGPTEGPYRVRDVELLDRGAGCAATPEGPVEVELPNLRVTAREVGFNGAGVSLKYFERRVRHCGNNALPEARGVLLYPTRHLLTKRLFVICPPSGASIV